MEEQYKTYRADQLLNDSSFLDFLHRSDPENNLYWEKLLGENSSLQREAQLAEKIWKEMKIREHSQEMDPENVRKLWKQIERQNQLYDQKKKRKYYLFILSSGVAASLLFGLFFSIGEYHKEESLDYHTILMQADSSFSNEQITLVLSDSREVMFEETEINIDYNEQGMISVHTEKTEKIEEKQSGKAFNQVIVPKGKRTFLTLSDGSRVWINAGSQLIYPVVFSENKREIYVEGEIFLDVTEDKKRPFLVKTAGMDIAVLGTRFNVSAYKEEKEQSVVLVEGKVEIEAKNRQKKILYPKQKFSLKEEQIHITHVDTDFYTAWVEGYYMFEHESLNTIINKLARYYGKNIIYREDTIYTATGKLDLKNDLKDVLTTLQKVSPIQICYQTDTIFIDVNP